MPSLVVGNCSGARILFGEMFLPFGVCLSVFVALLFGTFPSSGVYLGQCYVFYLIFTIVLL